MYSYFSFQENFDHSTTEVCITLSYSTLFGGRCQKVRPPIDHQLAADTLTILIYFHFNTFRNFKHYYLFYVKNHLQDLFPNQLSYNRFIELEPRVAVEMMLFIQLFCFGRCTGISFIDSTCVPVCHNKRIKRNKVFKGYAEIGKSTMGWYFGFKLHLICNERGELLNFMLTKANVDDRNPEVFNRLIDNVFGKFFADKGYISQGLFERLFNDGIELVTGLKCNMKNKLMPLYDKILLRKRSVIETINDELKNVAQLVHSRHRSVFNFAMNVLSVLVHTASMRRSCPSTSIIASSTLMGSLLLYNKGIFSLLTTYRLPFTLVEG